MMCCMTSVAQGDQISWLIAAASGARKQMMNIGFIRTARLSAFDALEIIASKDAFSNPLPVTFDCARHADLALRSWTQAARADEAGRPWSDTRYAVIRLDWTSQP